MGKQNTSYWCSLVMLIFGILTAYFAYYSFTGRDPLNAESGLQGLTGIIKRWDGPDFLDGVIVGGGTEPEEDEDIGWKPNGKHGVGLVLTVANACSSEWNEHFSTAMLEWDRLGEDLEFYGNVDILELTMKDMEHDVECSQSAGILKVCNGNYGETDWKGVNEVLIMGGYISSSVAKMNEFYLGDENGEGLGVGVFETKGGLWNERRYTMCHEMGHGLGLGHADTNFFNADLNTCMDYTNHPQNNLKPNEGDFAKLGKLYGGKDFLEISDLYSPEEAQMTESEAGITTGVPTQTPGKNKDKDKNKKDKNDTRKLKYQNVLRNVKRKKFRQESIFSYRRINADKVTRSITSKGEMFEIWTYYTPVDL
eukprot:CAMPEP_0194330114 /NCGR_PEP_ID=MMETSP0171-20130528/50629_1 /TAXON_ID=218684 /ORGANISM="Corethron pennatum, Strain L29A3" /LENGTH=365 /DNA_ID=CAMNT_0039091073 /DNA_START=607 /DNA_END=1701 /DNA_ORIENTATION=-